MKLRKICLKGCNISTDCLYTSIPLAKWLLDHDITTIGTLNTVRIDISDELKDTKCKVNFSVTCHIESKEIKLIQWKQNILDARISLC